MAVHTWRSHTVQWCTFHLSVFLDAFLVGSQAPLFSTVRNARRPRIRSQQAAPTYSGSSTSR